MLKLILVQEEAYTFVNCEVYEMSIRKIKMTNLNSENVLIPDKWELAEKINELIDEVNELKEELRLR